MLGAGHKCSCMVRNMKMVKEMDIYVAEAKIIDVPVYSVLS